MINFVKGKKYFYISTTDNRYGHRIQQGTFVKRTPRCCVLLADVPGQGIQKLRKLQTLVFETEKEARVVVIKDIIDRYGIGVIDIGAHYHELIEEYPEKFV